MVLHFRTIFCSRVATKNLTWHTKEKKMQIEKMQCHRILSLWSLVDFLWQEFAVEVKNLRLGITANGINPLSLQSNRYSCWHVITIVYNIPHWMCMKQKFMMLMLLISRSKYLVQRSLYTWSHQLMTWRSYEIKVSKPWYVPLREVHFKSSVAMNYKWFLAFNNFYGHTVKIYYACPIYSELFGCRLFHYPNHLYTRQKTNLSMDFKSLECFWYH